MVTFSLTKVIVEVNLFYRDTVSSVGFIKQRSLPGTTSGMMHVCAFRHALALDDSRTTRKVSTWVCQWWQWARFDLPKSQGGLVLRFSLRCVGNHRQSGLLFHLELWYVLVGWRKKSQFKSWSINCVVWHPAKRWASPLDVIRSDLPWNKDGTYARRMEVIYPRLLNKSILQFSWIYSHSPFIIQRCRMSTK